ncbi:MAG: Rrf2 family transcriptional regulator [Spirochaetaceae bacterium]|nr:Rrf2 family transcriptional regulator [Spirochaetaceae bacterium]
MKISGRFSVAIHILTLLKLTRQEVPTSSYIAESVKTNPVVIRRILAMLKKAGLVEVKRGSGGAFLQKSSHEITLLDIYKAVCTDKDGDLFKKQSDPNYDCPVGAHIQSVVKPAMSAAQDALDFELKKVTITDISKQILKEIRKEVKI